MPPLPCKRRPVVLDVGGSAHLHHNQLSFDDGEPTCHFPVSKFNKATVQTLQPPNRGYVCINLKVFYLCDKQHWMVGSSMPTMQCCLLRKHEMLTFMQT